MYVTHRCVNALYTLVIPVIEPATAKLMTVATAAFSATLAPLANSPTTPKPAAAPTVPWAIFKVIMRWTGIPKAFCDDRCSCWNLYQHQWQQQTWSRAPTYPLILYSPLIQPNFVIIFLYCTIIISLISIKFSSISFPFVVKKMSLKISNFASYEFPMLRLLLVTVCTPSNAFSFLIFRIVFDMVATVLQYPTVSYNFP